ncbi:bifunctional aspartate kinase/homoserine dehydrogenase I [Woeseiaceae bacterium]|nr:bifunctional aspartate kinase/homoserine dehydrogenase I [Woeseiaceae bacterium]
MKDRNWKIFKFGGSSLADTQCFVRVSKIILDCYYKDPTLRHAIVVSALGGVTDLLIDIASNCNASNLYESKQYQAINQRISTLVKNLLEESAAKEFLESFSNDIDSISKLLAEDLIYEDNADQVIAGFGELWSAKILSLYIAKLIDNDKEVEFIDSRKVIYLKTTDLGDVVDWNKSNDCLKKVIVANQANIFVITGFIASNERGLPTNLGRNGSDYSAAICASLFEAQELVIWTDVNGVMSADPGKVNDARVVSNLSYNEAMELAYFGAKVIHPKTLSPLMKQKIPVFIRNTFNPEAVGSKISAEKSVDRNIKGITVIDSMALINLEGTGMIGVPGTADKLFVALKNENISVTLISQASSEHSICIAVDEGVSNTAKKVIENAFENELKAGLISKIEATKGQSIIAVVGDEMTGQSGVAGQFFGTLGRAGINIRAIAQGSSERNISAVIESKDALQALNKVHAGFFDNQPSLTIGLIGPGLVGSELLDQINSHLLIIAAELGVNIHLKAIVKSKYMLLGNPSIDLTKWRETMQEEAIHINLNTFEAHLTEHSSNGHILIIDCTSNDSIAKQYKRWLGLGINVITPNKKAFSDDLSYYKTLKDISVKNKSYCFYETTVAAGLPVLNTINSLVSTGDKIHSIEGILSGTLAYLFNVFDGSKPFSRIVIEAKENGYTEPDPRDDLGGMDVARKLTILAREAGRGLDISDFAIESLVPDDLIDAKIDEFLEKLKDYDSVMQDRYETAKNNNLTLRYIASIDIDNNIFIGLKEYPIDHPFSNIQLTDNIIKIQSDRYADNPLIVQGPGAGPGVTAAGISADIINLIKLIK